MIEYDDDLLTLYAAHSIALDMEAAGEIEIYDDEELAHFLHAKCNEWEHSDVNLYYFMPEQLKAKYGPKESNPDIVSYLNSMGVPVEYPYKAFCEDVDDTARMLLSWLVTRSVAERNKESEALYDLIQDQVHREARTIQENTRGHICDGEIGVALISVLTKLVERGVSNG